MKLNPLIVLVSVISTGSSFGAAGIFDELLWATTTTPFAFGSSTFYEIDSDTGNLFGAAEFDGANLGIFNEGDSLFLTGEQKSFKNDFSDVSGHTLHWQVGANSGTLIYGFEADLGGGDQRWGSANGGFLTSNVLDGLSPGLYTLAVWSSISTNGVNAPAEIFNNLGGANYNATLEIIPEPSAALIGGLGFLSLVIRRKR